MRKLILPLLFFFLFVLESLFIQFLPAGLYDSKKILVPHFLIASILFLTIFGSEKNGIIYGLIFGLLFDVVNVEIIGIYLLLYPLVVYVVAKIMKILQANIFIASIVSLLGVSLVEIGAFEMYTIIHITSMDFMTFLKMRLVPTLLLNAGFIIIAVYPLKRLFEKYASLRME
ncbi:MAG: rod shape-determining protein MreD [Bacillota bacterium]|nr:rod shape-determining protein MreD [Bacillota bacterium]